MDRGKLTVKVTEDEEHGPEVIAKAIEEIAASAKKLLGGRLSRRAVIVLIQDSTTGLSKAAIEAVLDAAAGLTRYVTRKP